MHPHSGATASEREPALPAPGDRRIAGRGTASLSLWKNFSWITAGRLVYIATQWGTLAVLAKLGSPAMVGELGLALAITMPVFKFSNLGLRHAQATDVERAHPFGEYMGLRSLASLASVVVIAGIGASLGHGIETAIVIALIGASRSFASVGEVFHACFQLYERMDHVARSLVLRGVASVALLAAGVIATGRLWVGVLGMALASVAVLAVHDIPLGRRVLRHREGEAHASVSPSWQRARLWRLTRQTLPLGIAGALFSLQQSTPRLFLAQGTGLEELGYFAAMIYIAAAGNELVQGLGHSAVARLARLYASGNTRAFASLLARVSLIGIFFGVVGLAVAWVAGAPVLTLLYTSDYGRHADVFVWVMFGALIRYVASMLHFGTTAARRFRAHLVNHVVVAVVALAASALWIPDHGILGAAWVGVAAAVADLVCSAGINAMSIRARAAEAFRCL